MVHARGLIKLAACDVIDYGQLITGVHPCAVICHSQSEALALPPVKVTHTAAYWMILIVFAVVSVYTFLHDLISPPLVHKLGMLTLLRRSGLYKLSLLGGQVASVAAGFNVLGSFVFFFKQELGGGY